MKVQYDMHINELNEKWTHYEIHLQNSRKFIIITVHNKNCSCKLLLLLQSKM